MVSLALWMWALRHRPRPDPAFACRLPSLLLQVAALDDGVHFVAMRTYGSRTLCIEYGRATYLGNAGYHHGVLFRFAGFVAVALFREDRFGDLLVSPHTALVLPYWFLILVTGWLSLRCTGLNARLAPLCHPSSLSLRAAGLAGAVLVILNLVPHAWKPGSAIQPGTVGDFLTLMFRPGYAYSDIMLEYGFPFVCYRRAIRNGQSVDLYYGASTGWVQHKVMEDLCIVAVAVLAALILTEWLKRRRSGATGSRPTQMQVR
ncbi:MAG: hypothetical protein NTW87_06515 [Planctomycetota bacterium]|nr:hypothetical protein [Planctomycetota bacterium]